ncbi:hypothetical protein N2152v2_009596 [Parachlorella kessleri]
MCQPGKQELAKSPVPVETALQVDAKGDLVGPDGTVVLQQLTADAQLRNHAGGVVLGLACTSKEPAALLDVPLGKLPASSRFMALSKAKQYWMVPAWGSTAAELPIETQLLLLELGGSAVAAGEEPVYAVVAPLIDGNRFRASLRPARPGNKVPLDTLILREESGDEYVASNTFKNSVFIQVGSDPYQLLDQGMEAAVKLSGSGRMRWEKPQPASLDMFGWCTWDAMWTDVCPKGIQEGLRNLQEGGTPARLLVIDDGWQQIDVDPEFRADALEGRKAHSAGEAEVEYNLMKLVSGEDEQAAEPLHEQSNGKLEAESGGKEQSKGAVGGGENGYHGNAAVVPANGKAQQQGLRQRLLGWASQRLWPLVQRAEVGAITLIRDTLETAPTGSRRMKLFAALMTGPLRQPVLRFYAQASCHSRRLMSIKANAKFDHIDQGPDAPLNSQASGFGDVVRELKKRYGLDYVYCWHAMGGYWSGIMPETPGTSKYKSYIQYPKPSEGTLEVDASFLWVQPVVAGVALPDDPRHFHRDLHAYLKESGVDGVKVDVEATICMFGHSGRGGYAAQGARWHSSLEDSVGDTFGGHAINSMCCSMEDLYNMKHSNIARVSEDFYPLIEASHWAHIANSAFITLMVGAISVPDWDMFMTTHDAAHLHATARAVSGGMIYVSDKTTEHDFGLLRRLVLPDGSTLRCRLPGRPTRDCLMRDVSRDGHTVMKVWNMNAVGGIVGLFNVQGATWRTHIRTYHQHDPAPRTLTAHVRPCDVPLLPKAERYVAYSDKLQEVKVLGRTEAWELSVPGGGGHDLVTLAPITQLGEVEVAPVGLVNMFNAGGAVREFAVKESGTGYLGRLKIHGCGRFLLWASQPPKDVTVEGTAVPVEYDPASQSAVFEVSKGASMDKEVLVRL